MERMKKNSRKGKIFMEIAEFVYNLYNECLNMPRNSDTLHFNNFFDFKRHVYNNKEVADGAKGTVTLFGWLARAQEWQEKKGKSIHGIIEENKDLEDRIEDTFKYLLKRGKNILVINVDGPYGSIPEREASKIDEAEKLLKNKEEFIKEITR